MLFNKKELEHLPFHCQQYEVFDDVKTEELVSSASHKIRTVNSAYHQNGQLELTRSFYKAVSRRFLIITPDRHEP
jgi:hypothetical protein